VDEAKPPEVSRAEPEETKVRDEYAAAVPDQDVGNLPATVQQEAQLTSDLPGQLRQAAGYFRGYDLLCTGFTPAEPLYPLELTGLKACGFSFKFRYGVSSGKSIKKPVYISKMKTAVPVKDVKLYRRGNRVEGIWKIGEGAFTPPPLFLSFWNLKAEIGNFHLGSYVMEIREVILTLDIGLWTLDFL